MRALICGVSGQDGAYLAKLLLSKGYEVFGSSRDASACRFDNLRRLAILNDVHVESMDLTDFRGALALIKKLQPDEIYNLAGQTSVGLSFEQPVEAMQSIGTGTLNLLEVVRCIGASVRYYNAGSSDCFGDTGSQVANEATPFRPRSPYGVAKASAHFLVQNYREAYDIFACTGILFNHESPLRPQRFVTQKIVTAAASIHAGSRERLKLGDLSVSRDWGWAPDYVEAMWLMLQQTDPHDYVVATGRTCSLQYFVEKTFAYFGLDWKAHVDIDQALMRPADISISRADPSKARRALGWSPSKDVDGVIAGMCESASVKP